MTTPIDEQRAMCTRYGSEYTAAPQGMKVGIAKNVRDGILPIHGLRHPPTEGTTGWYIWAGGDLPDDPEFFVPLHVEHLRTWCPEVIRFLGLAPGWRFLVAGDYEDVWADSTLLNP